MLLPAQSGTGPADLCRYLGRFRRTQERRRRHAAGAGDGGSGFDKNTSAFSGRITKHKGTSLSFYHASDGRERYDLIYVDGSHRSDDVIVDAVNCFRMLTDGGILIFDDYFWTYYEAELENPASAINAFLRMKRHRLEILSFDYQLIVRKRPGGARREQA
ncbi:MAG: class I SAM-dependent methyltransferase [Alphaproteobacteria bacterium]|nr:class I SAM-dependent methyltransferase [Alphaproteobacteria bacterium]